MTQALATFVIAIVLLVPLRAHAELRCESLFESRDKATTQATTTTPVKSSSRDVLEAAINELEAERILARTREWTADQIEEIHLKGRLEFDTEARAVKYYRGLIVWKIRELTAAKETIFENETIAHFKSMWPSKVMVSDTPVLLFANPFEFLTARRLTHEVLNVGEPNPEQIATVMITMGRIRSIKRTPWIDAKKFENNSLEVLHRVFESVTPEQLRAISEGSFIKLRDVECCGTGNCAGCTHPNVVFRDRTRWHGPTHLEAASASSLPLYKTMDLLRSQFPDERWGTNFWDTRVDFETGRP
ncbi:hypothetical protein BH10BDE1_BH10BDE1_12630 [soil metagenome]